MADIEKLNAITGAQNTGVTFNPAGDGITVFIDTYEDGQGNLVSEKEITLSDSEVSELAQLGILKNLDGSEPEIDRNALTVFLETQSLYKLDIG